MENAAGRDLDWFWRQWVYTTARLDQAVDSVRAVGRDSTWVFLSNRGQMTLPVTLELALADGARQRRTFPVDMWNLGSAFTARIATPQPVVAVTLDPDGRYPDVDRANDRWRRGPATAP
jgi:hypothetical protein